jgi:hypothetical protein
MNRSVTTIIETPLLIGPLVVMAKAAMLFSDQIFNLTRKGEEYETAWATSDCSNDDRRPRFRRTATLPK